MKNIVKSYWAKFLSLILIFMFLSVGNAFAYTGSASLQQPCDFNTYRGIFVEGYNMTQGFSSPLPAWISGTTGYYSVPDDGCTWRIAGFAQGYGGNAEDPTVFPISSYFSTTVTTSGSFSGYSPKTATDAANNAASYAQTAATNANDAKTAANNAYTAANDAKTAAQNAQTYAQTAANNTTYNSQSAAYWAYQAALATPPTIKKIKGQNNATCTTGSSFTLVIFAEPSSGVQYRVTCGTFDSGWTANNTITISSGIVSGVNTATVQVKNTATGATSQETFTFFKI